MGMEAGEGQNMQFFQLKSKADDNAKPHFAQSEKVNGQWAATKTGDIMKGMLAGAKIETRKIKEVDHRFFVLFFADDNGLYKVQMGHNKLSYNIINSLSSAPDSISEFKISVYKKQSEDGKYWNSKASVTKNGGKVEWHVDPRTAPEREPVYVGKPPKQQVIGGKEVWDYSAQAEFWEKMFTERLTKVLGEGGASAAPIQSVGTPPVIKPKAKYATEDDLPF